MLDTYATATDLVNAHIETLTEKKKETFLKVYDARRNCFTARGKELVFFNSMFNGMAWLGESSRGGFEVIAYSGRRKKQDFYYRYSTKDDAMKKVQAWADSKIKAIKDKEERKQKEKELQKKLKDFVKVGDIFKDSWGYEQTNVDYYQLVGFKGKSTGIFREISGDIIERHCGDSGRIVPCPDDFIGEEFEKRLNVRQWSVSNSPTIYFSVNSFSTASLKKANADGTYSSDHISWGY